MPDAATPGTTAQPQPRAATLERRSSSRCDGWRPRCPRWRLRCPCWRSCRPASPGSRAASAAALPCRRPAGRRGMMGRQAGLALQHAKRSRRPADWAAAAAGWPGMGTGGALGRGRGAAALLCRPAPTAQAARPGTANCNQPPQPAAPASCPCTRHPPRPAALSRPPRSLPPPAHPAARCPPPAPPCRPSWPAAAAPTCVQRRSMRPPVSQAGPWDGLGPRHWQTGGQMAAQDRRLNCPPAARQARWPRARAACPPGRQPRGSSAAPAPARHSPRAQPLARPPGGLELGQAAPVLLLRSCQPLLQLAALAARLVSQHPAARCEAAASRRGARQGSRVWGLG
jgi:hypothetical protein